MLLSSGNGVDSIVQLITVLVIFVFVLAVTYLVTKWIAGFQKQQNTGKNIQVVETTRMSPNQYAQILKLGKNKYVAVAVSKENVTLLATLEEDDIDEDTQSNVARGDFSDILKKMKTSFKEGNKPETDENDRTGNE